MFVAALLTAFAAYFVGSIPTGYLVGRARGVDLRAHGSGNIGATNALRVLGKPAGSFVPLVDALKGLCGATIVPALAIRWTFGPDDLVAGRINPGVPPWLLVVGGVCAVLGHNFTCWLRFKGGKGIAPSAGVLAGLLPQAFLAVLVVFLLCLLVTRIVSLSSITAAALLPIATWYWHRRPVYLAFALVLATLAIWRHRANIRRLLAGTEPRLGRKPAPAPAPGGPASTPSTR